MGIEDKAREFASDAIPLRRDNDGAAIFYRRDLERAFLAGAAAVNNVVPMVRKEPGQ